MKWMVASDIHGSAKYCRELLDAYEREKADRLLLLGDLLYHGPRNDLPDEYAPKMVIAMLNAKKNQILCVRGNCDAEVRPDGVGIPDSGGLLYARPWNETGVCYTRASDIGRAVAAASGGRSVFTRAHSCADE